MFRCMDVDHSLGEYICYNFKFLKWVLLMCKYCVCRRVGEVISSVVNRYGVSWVVSAGNHGPALGTVGTPPDIAQPVLIGRNAYTLHILICFP